LLRFSHGDYAQTFLLVRRSISHTGHITSLILSLLHPLLTTLLLKQLLLSGG
jgi:hypothetical protein